MSPHNNDFLGNLTDWGNKCNLSTPDLFSFELFLPWIDKIMKVYPDNQDNSNDFINQTGHSNEYYKRKIN